jgi:hypothetical protein
MPLPAVSDSLLLAELAAIVTAGWQLQQQSQHEGDVRRLLEAVPIRSRAGAFRQRAHDLLVMIDEALVDAAAAGDDEIETALLTDDQSTGLRILFGTHPAYRDATARTRRDNCAEYLGDSRRGGGRVSGDTLYKRRQPQLLQLALDAFRQRWGQDPTGTRHRTETETVSVSLRVDDYGRLTNVDCRYRLRARRDRLERCYLRAEVPAGADPKPTVTQLEGAALRHIHEWIPGHLSVALQLEDAVPLAARFEIAFHLTYRYVEPPRRHAFGHYMHWEHNDYYRLSIDCQFAALPSTCWRFQESLLSYPEPGFNNVPLAVGADGLVTSDTAATASRMAHGVAWAY